MLVIESWWYTVNIDALLSRARADCVALANMKRSAEQIQRVLDDVENDIRKISEAIEEIEKVPKEMKRDRY